jgi:hypothetical protein
MGEEALGGGTDLSGCRKPASMMPFTALSSSTSRRNPAPMALRPTAMPVDTKPVNETLSVPGCSKAFAHLTYTGQHVQRASRQAGVNRQLWPAGNLINPNVEPLDQKW